MTKFHHFLINIFHLHEKKSQQGFKELGLSKGQPKLIELLYYEGGCAQKDLAAACSIEPATVTSLLGNMQMKELVYKTPDVLESGVRIQRVYLTEKGQSVAKEVDSIVNRMEEVSFNGFTEEEKAQCVSFMERIYLNLRDYQ